MAYFGKQQGRIFGPGQDTEIYREMIPAEDSMAINRPSSGP